MFNLTSDKTLKNVLALLLVVAVLFVVYKMYMNYQEGFESRENGAEAYSNNKKSPGRKEEKSNNPNNDGLMVGRGNNEKETFVPKLAKRSDDPGMNAVRESFENPVDRDMQNAQMMGMGSEHLTAQDLLPQDNSSVWAQVNPDGEGTLANKNFLQAGYHIGINTVGQTLRNANLQLRSEPPCPQVQVSPWSQSTIEPDVSRRPMEIGGCA